YLGPPFQWKTWTRIRGCSSIGRAPALQAGGRRFDSVQLHQVLPCWGRRSLKIAYEGKKHITANVNAFKQAKMMRAPILTFGRDESRLAGVRGEGDQARKGVRRMPRCREAMKDVGSCEKPRGA